MQMRLGSKCTFVTSVVEEIILKSSLEKEENS